MNPFPLLPIPSYTTSKADNAFANPRICEFPWAAVMACYLVNRWHVGKIIIFCIAKARSVKKIF